MSAVIEFGSEHTFKVDNVVVKPGSLFSSQVVSIHGHSGSYKVVGKVLEKGKLFIKVVKMPQHLFMTFHQNFNETFGVEAVSGRNQPQPTEYLIERKGVKSWVRATDCLGHG